MLSCGSKFFPLKKDYLFTFFRKVPFGFPDHNTGQANQRNQVGDCHQAVQGVSDTPSQAQFHRRADEDDHQEDDLIGA